MITFNVYLDTLIRITSSANVAASNSIEGCKRNTLLRNNSCYRAVCT